MRLEPLTTESIGAALGDLPGWSFESERLSKTYVLASFRDAMAFLIRLSFEAEDLNHHPEINNVYNRVSIALTTHDVGNRVTQLDLDLAGRIERIYKGL
jgi:4a-hydroxytetrahydrobiopterin dehydratase